MISPLWGHGTLIMYLYIHLNDPLTMCPMTHCGVKSYCMGAVNVREDHKVAVLTNAPALNGTSGSNMTGALGVTAVHTAKTKIPSTLGEVNRK